MNLSVCIDALFRGKDSAETVDTLAALGIDAFEFWSWWDKDLDALARAKQRHQLTLAACCTRFISLVDAAQREAYLAGLHESIAVAQRLNCQRLISQVGDDLGIDRAIQRQSLIDGLRASVPLLESAEIILVFEPLNTLIDHPGYYLTHSAEAFEIVEAVGSPNVQVVFDIYHQQITEGNVIRNITNNIDKIGHFHTAGNPGRHELDRGELNYPEIFRAIDATGYDGYVGLEYFPVDDPVAGLSKLIQGASYVGIGNG